MYTIQFYFADQQHQPLKVVDALEGLTILEIALNQSIPLPHDCGGICSCTTCHVFIQRGMASITAMEARERSFLQLKGLNDPSIRLACQCILRQGQGSLDILIPE